MFPAVSSSIGGLAVFDQIMSPFQNVSNREGRDLNSIPITGLTSGVGDADTSEEEMK